MTAIAVLLKIVIGATLIIAGFVLAIWGATKGVQGLFWLLTSIFRGIGFIIRRITCFVSNTFTDTGRSVGALLTALVLVPLTTLNFLFGRWSQGSHYAGALEDELVAFGLGIYRVLLGNPLHLIGLNVLTEGFERRLPEVVARAPRTPRASAKEGKFEGYKVTGVLPAGGSGARLFLAKPRPKKLQEIIAAGYTDPDQVVIKSFNLGSGSTMPQIVRESRALQSARRLGLVIEHELTDTSFFYVMPYVPGENLDVVITRQHESATPAGLSDRQLRVFLGYAGDLLYTLDAFHGGGLWHKDIKPSNLIISGGRAHLVDLGLVTPLESAMTLTTHGTEYYRDPDMVRLALKGVKVHEVNGVKFDLYSTGALLYSMVENSFPAQGSLSQITRRCPEAVRWIVRRAMSDLDSRYGSAQEMLADIRTVLAARDPFSVRPADLPSMGGKSDWSLKRASFAAGSQPLRPLREGASLKNGSPGTEVKQRRRSTGRSLATALVGMLFLAGSGALALMAIEGEGPFREPTTDKQWALQEAKAAASSESGNRLGAVRKAWARELPRDLRPSKLRRSRSRDVVKTVLVLEDPRLMSDQALVRGLYAELESHGIEAIGAPEDGIGDERDIMYVASARKAVGVSDPSDPEAVQELERFLEDHPSLDRIIWIASGDDDESLQYRIISPRSSDVSLPSTFAVR